MSQAQSNIRALPANQNGRRSEAALPESQQSWLTRYFMPRPETKVMAEHPSRGIFLPYPLLAVIVTLSIVVISGIVALEVQVSNLNTTLLLRDADQRAEIIAIKEKSAQLEVYIHDMREKRVQDRADIETLKDKRRQP